MNTVVYQWLREDGTPYYIGIGNPRRPYIGRRSCGRPPSRDRIVILHENLEWEEACRIERDLIAFYGRKDLGTGILRNLTDGGEGFSNLSEETREKMSKALSGKSHSKETKEKISKSLSGENNPNFGKFGENHPSYGKSLSEETRQKISRKHKGKQFSEETRRKISEATRGENHHSRIPRDWWHPVHGTVLRKSASELARLFPEQNLHRGHLAEVARGNGKRFQHKGWITLKA